MMRTFRPYVLPARAMLVTGLLASVAVAVMEWAAPWPLKFIFDSVLGHRPLPGWLGWLPGQRASLLVALTGAMVLVAAGRAVADYLSNRLVATAGQRVVLDIRCQLFRHIEGQALSFHQRRQTGDLLARLGGDVQAIQSAVVNAVPTLVRNLLTLAGMVAILVVIDWRYALLALVVAPVLAWGTRYYLARIKSVQRRARQADGDAASVAQEALTAITAVQAFGTEDTEAARYAAATGRGLVESRRAIVAQSEFTPLVTLASTASTALAVFFGARAVMSGRLTPGDLLVFMAYLKGMYSPVRQLSKLAGVVSRAQAASERVVDILATEERVPEVRRPRPVRRARGTLELDDVHYSYPDGRGVLAGVDLQVPAGTRQGLVGLSGSGKSTLLRLVPRFMDPTSGAVRLDGVDISELALADLRRQVALVPQEPYLFRATVWENIVYGSPGAGREAAVAAARAAGLHDLVESLPEGYATLVVERGSNLSGGQRQCLAIARAMARNAPVLLLDEPTVGLDAELEAVVLAALERLAEGRTTITVSHQLLALRTAQQIAVLSNGRVSESGTHEQLLAGRRTYWRLDRLQRGDTGAVPPPDWQERASTSTTTKEKHGSYRHFRH